eukprot:GHVU01215540.1.p1 GENE.GHVU01215540.1~~GHVU01215540.1.p1  ORF type:complete len:354 (-),score=98.72 GHVU01215540.1:658-1719(-)
MAERCSMETAGGASVCRVSDVPLIVPRGRYELEFTTTSVKLHGKSYDFNINYSSITAVYRLPSATTPQKLLLLGLDKALSQGNTRYQSVLMQFQASKAQAADVEEDDDEGSNNGERDADEEVDAQHLAQQKSGKSRPSKSGGIEVTLNASPEQLAAMKKLQPSVDKKMEGPMFKVVLALLQALCKRTVVGNWDHDSPNKTECVRTSYKASDGHLYLLEKQLIFLPKPAIIFKHEDILNVSFSRTSGSQTRFCELRLTLRGGGDIDFTSIERKEHERLSRYLRSRGIKVMSEDGDNQPGKADVTMEQEDLPSSDDEDEDFDGANADESPSESSSDDDDEDEEDGGNEKDGDAAK